MRRRNSQWEVPGAGLATLKDLRMEVVNGQSQLSLYCALMKHSLLPDDPSSSVKVYSHNCLL